MYTKKRRQVSLSRLPPFGRDEATRTPDPYVPNVVRYQLRYIPNAMKADAKVQLFLEYQAQISKKYCEVDILSLILRRK